MRKLFKLINGEMCKNNRLFAFVATLLLIGFIAGSLFVTILNETDKQLVLDTISNYFKQSQTRPISFFSVFRTSIISNLLFLLLIWLLGVSIIGIPFIFLLIFTKSFILGFSVAGIISKYMFGGVLLSFSYTFPHHIINMVIVSFAGLYALKVSFSLFQLIFSKKQINFKLVMRKYIGVLFVSFILCLLSSCIETFITPYFIGLFNFLI